MVCIFCRSQTHNKSNCDNENTRLTETLIMRYFNEIYVKTTELRLTRHEFDYCVSYILGNKLTINELKMGIEYYKRMLFWFDDYSRRNLSIKSVIIDTLTRMVCDIYAFEFAPPANNTIINENPNNLHTTDVIREVLRMEFSRTRRHTGHNGWRRAYVPYIPRAYCNNKLSQIQVSITTDNCNEEDCPICFEKLDNASYIRLTCSHEFCKKCIIECITKNIRKCGLCRSPITKLYTQNGNKLY